MTSTPAERKHIIKIAPAKLEGKHSELIAIAQIIATPPERKHIKIIATAKLEKKHSEPIVMALAVEVTHQQCSRVTSNTWLRTRKRTSNSLVEMAPKMTRTIPWVKSTTPWGTRKMTRGPVGTQRQEVNNTSRNIRRQQRRMLRLRPSLTQPIYPQCLSRTLNNQ